ncbi:MAG TPA: MFS transporter [Burkholderiales bacterium]|jgi:PPP family 3-phenylpropionic acid transporter|nr:MFS transporter [Burkholderiales bacterium]
MFRPSLYFQLSSFYFWYFAFIGAFAPYFALYLQSLGYSPLQIAALMAINPVSRIYGPNLWGWLADHYRARGAVLRACAVATALIFAAVLLHPGFWAMFVLLAVLNLFWSGILPIAEASTLGLLGSRVGTYGRIRLWGSVGFVAVVIAGGHLLERLGIRTLEPLVLVLLVLTAAMTFAMPRERSVSPRAQKVSLADALSRPGVIALLTGFFLMQVAHGPYNTFYSIYLVESGYSEAVVGSLWAAGVLAEIVLFMTLPRIMKRWTIERILLASFACATLRFLMIAWGVGSIAVLAVAQLLHAATFGAFHAAGVAAMHRIFRGPSQARGQALYTSFGYGAGGTLGTLAAGALWEWEYGGGAVTFSAAALTAGCAWLLLARVPARLANQR